MPPAFAHLDAPRICRVVLGAEPTTVQQALAQFAKAYAGTGKALQDRWSELVHAKMCTGSTTAEMHLKAPATAHLTLLLPRIAHQLVRRRRLSRCLSTPAGPFFKRTRSFPVVSACSLPLPPPRLDRGYGRQRVKRGSEVIKVTLSLGRSWCRDVAGK